MLPSATENQNPEQKARDIIDEQLRASGWTVQNKDANPYVAAMCSKLQEKWPSLLGAGPAGCSWEWTWQQQGATRFMHNPEYFGLLQFESGGPVAPKLRGTIAFPPSA